MNDGRPASPDLKEQLVSQETAVAQHRIPPIRGFEQARKVQQVDSPNTLPLTFLAPIPLLTPTIRHGSDSLMIFAIPQVHISATPQLAYTSVVIRDIRHPCAGPTTASTVPLITTNHSHS